MLLPRATFIFDDGTYGWSETHCLSIGGTLEELEPAAMRLAERRAALLGPGAILTWIRLSLTSDTPDVSLIGPLTLTGNLGPVNGADFGFEAVLIESDGPSTAPFYHASTYLSGLPRQSMNPQTLRWNYASVHRAYDRFHHELLRGGWGAVHQLRDDVLPPAVRITNIVHDGARLTITAPGHGLLPEVDVRINQVRAFNGKAPRGSQTVLAVLDWQTLQIASNDPSFVYLSGGWIYQDQLGIVPYQNIYIAMTDSHKRGDRYHGASWETPDNAGWPISPCGEIVDVLRACYPGKMSFGPEPTMTIPVRWYFAPRGAKVVPYTLFGSSVWRDKRFPAGDLGDSRAKYAFDPGENRLKLKGTCRVGSQRIWVEGLNETDSLAPIIYPPCCGAQLIVKGKGSFLLGGTTLSTSEANVTGSGGFLLGGTAPYTVEFNVAGKGSLLLGGTAPVTSETTITGSGGFLLGGSAPYSVEYLITASGGFTLGGDMGLIVTDVKNSIVWTGITRIDVDTTSNLVVSQNTPQEVIIGSPIGGGIPAVDDISSLDPATGPPLALTTGTRQGLWRNTGSSYAPVGITEIGSLTGIGLGPITNRPSPTAGVPIWIATDGGTVAVYVVIGGAWVALATPTLTPVPPSVSGLATGTILDTSVQLTWTNPTGVDKAAVWYATAVDGPWTLASGAAAPGYTVAGLTATTTYYFVVCARSQPDGSGLQGPWQGAGPVTATTKHAAPAIPLITRATPVSPTEIDLSTTVPSGAVDIKFYRSTVSGGPYSFIGQTPSSGYDDTGLTASTTYYYVATAINSDGVESAQSAQVSATTLASGDGPASVSPWAWFKPDTLSAGTLGTWADSSGNGNNATGVNSPTVSLNQIAGFPAVNFTSGGPYFTLPAIPSGSFTYFAVVKFGPPGELPQCIVGNHPGGVEWRWLGQMEINESGTTAPVLSNTTVPLSTWLQVGVRFAGTTVNFYYHGSADGTQTTTLSSNPVNSFIGVSETPSLADAFVGWMAELLIYSSALSDADVGAVEAYLHTKYGL
jgi:Concanavalin A-like lectin/glucanases superfamily